MVVSYDFYLVALMIWQSVELFRWRVYRYILLKEIKVVKSTSVGIVLLRPWGGRCITVRDIVPVFFTFSHLSAGKYLNYIL